MGVVRMLVVYRVYLQVMGQWKIVIIPEMLKVVPLWVL